MKKRMKISKKLFYKKLTPPLQASFFASLKMLSCKCSSGMTLHILLECQRFLLLCKRYYRLYFPRFFFCGMWYFPVIMLNYSPFYICCVACVVTLRKPDALKYIYIIIHFDSLLSAWFTRA